MAQHMQQPQKAPKASSGDADITARLARLEALLTQQAQAREADAAAVRAMHNESMAAVEKSVQALLPPLKAALDKVHLPY